MPPKPFLDKLLAAKDHLRVGMFYHDLARLLMLLGVAERGQIKNNDGVDLVRVLKVERVTEDKGFAFATFRIMDFDVRMAILSTEKESMVHYISTIDLMVDHEAVKVTQSTLKAIGFYQLEIWRPSNTLYWVNMMLAWEHRHNHPST